MIYEYYKENIRQFNFIKSEEKYRASLYKDDIEIMYNVSSLDVSIVVAGDTYAFSCKNDHIYLADIDEKIAEGDNIFIGCKELVLPLLKTLLDKGFINKVFSRYNPFKNSITKSLLSYKGKFHSKELGDLDLYYFNSYQQGYHVVTDKNEDIKYIYDPYNNEYISLKSDNGNYKEVISKFYSIDHPTSYEKQRIEYNKATSDIGVVIVGGSGNLDIDGNSGDIQFNTKKNLVKLFNQENISTIRYADYYFKDYGWLDQNLERLHKSINILDRDISIKKIYLVGHSQGCLMLVNSVLNSPKLKGLIMLAPQIKEADTFLRDQYIKSSGNLSLNLNEIDEISQIVRANDRIMFDKKYSEKLGVDSERIYEMFNMNVKKLYKKIDMPMLLCHGLNDFQVESESSKTIFEMDRESRQVKLYQNINHFFHELELGYYGDYSRYDCEFSSKVFKDVVEFIRND